MVDQVMEVVLVVTLGFLLALCALAYHIGRREGYPDVYVGMGFLLVSAAIIAYVVAS